MWIILNMDGRFVSFGFSFAMIDDHFGYRGEHPLPHLPGLLPIEQYMI